MSESEKSVTEAASAAFEGVEGAVGLGVDIVEIARMRRILDEICYFSLISADDVAPLTLFIISTAIDREFFGKAAHFYHLSSGLGSQ